MAFSNLPLPGFVRNVPIPEPVRKGVNVLMHLLFASFFRFLIALGVVFLAAGAYLGSGVAAGHLGIYGTTSVAIGVIGRLVSRYKVNSA